MILEKDSDDDMVDATYASAENVQIRTMDGSSLNPGKGPVPKVTGAGAGKGPVLTGTDGGTPSKRKPRRPKTHPPVQAGERAAPRADEARAGAPPLSAVTEPLPNREVPSVGSAAAASSLAAGEDTLAKRKLRKGKAPMVGSVDEGAVPITKATDALGLNPPGPARGKRKLRKAHVPAGEEKKETGPVSNAVLQGEEPTCEPKMVGAHVQPCSTKASKESALLMDGDSEGRDYEGLWRCLGQGKTIERVDVDANCEAVNKWMDIEIDLDTLYNSTAMHLLSRIVNEIF
ncbi:unnamed protein product [Linum tenue]|uniref:Uncharacterized protein n=1 Tax=Linum tenue TaxID=586396 RepID=A0AAV0S0D9_9ROSI|nr:unnamed protein product [Linum tenue]